MKPLSIFVDRVIKQFKAVKPLWMPPHKTIYNVARKLKFADVKIDGRGEKNFNKTWERLFELGELEGESVKVTFTDANGKKQKLRFESDDLKEIHLK